MHPVCHHTHWFIKVVYGLFRVVFAIALHLDLHILLLDLNQVIEAGVTTSFPLASCQSAILTALTINHAHLHV